MAILQGVDRRMVLAPPWPGGCRDFQLGQAPAGWGVLNPLIELSIWSWPIGLQ
jgi:hypothetical protein